MLIKKYNHKRTAFQMQFNFFQKHFFTIHEIYNSIAVEKIILLAFTVRYDNAIEIPVHKSHEC